MEMKCRNCSGTLAYSIEKKKLVCPFCASMFAVEMYEPSGGSEEKKENAYLVDLYLCRSCGAELSAPEEQIVAYCTYCGGQTTLLEKSTKKDRPARIIPFSRTKKLAEKYYEDKIQKQPYLPAEFKEEGFVQSFRGIYIPYWKKSYSVTSPELELDGKKRYTRGKYDYVETYEIRAKMEGCSENYYDASEAFDDTLAAEIAPFHARDSVPFKEGYLAGFYADGVTVPGTVYDEISRKTMEASLETDLMSKTTMTSIPNTWKKEVQVEKNEDEVTLFPVWFLTWRKKDRVAYSVMNGQTGAMSIDLPVDLGRFFKVSGIMAAVFFLILSIFPIFILPMRLACAGSVFLVLSSWMLMAEMREIAWRESHKLDVGYQKEKFRLGFLKSAVKDNGTMKIHVKGGCLTMALKIMLGVILSGYLVAAFMVETPAGTGEFLFLPMVIELILSVMTWIYAFNMKIKTGMISSAVSFAALLWSRQIAGPSHPHDYWYYGIALFCITAMLLNALTAIHYINYLTTRPVPNFFHREGANHARES